MTIGFIVLGELGSRLTHRLLDSGHEAMVHDLDSKAVQALAEVGAIPVDPSRELVSGCEITGTEYDRHLA